MLKEAVVAYFKVLSRHWRGGIEKNYENLSQDSQFQGRYLNPGPPEYEAGFLTTSPRHSVFNCYIYVILNTTKWIMSKQTIVLILIKNCEKVVRRVLAATISLSRNEGL
jgi:hypothetical protein